MHFHANQVCLLPWSLYVIGVISSAYKPYLLWITELAASYSKMESDIRLLSVIRHSQSTNKRLGQERAMERSPQHIGRGKRESVRVSSPLLIYISQLPPWKQSARATPTSNHQSHPLIKSPNQPSLSLTNTTDCHTKEIDWTEGERTKTHTKSHVAQPQRLPAWRQWFGLFPVTHESRFVC